MTFVMRKHAQVDFCTCTSTAVLMTREITGPVTGSVQACNDFL